MKIHFNKNIAVIGFMVLAVVIIGAAVVAALWSRWEKVQNIATNNNVTKIFITPYIYISRISGMVGGFPYISDSCYINQNGLLQITKTSSNGILIKLIEIKMTQKDFKNTLHKLTLLPEKIIPTKKDKGYLVEYYHPNIYVKYFSPETGINEVTYAEDMIPSILLQVIEMLKTKENTTKDNSVYVVNNQIYVQVNSRNVLYGKIDVKIENIDEMKNWIKNAVQNEGSFVLAGDLEHIPQLQTDVTVIPGRNLLVQLNQQLYSFIFYQYQPDAKIQLGPKN